MSPLRMVAKFSSPGLEIEVYPYLSQGVSEGADIRSTFNGISLSPFRNDWLTLLCMSSNVRPLAHSSAPQDGTGAAATRNRSRFPPPKAKAKAPPGSKAPPAPPGPHWKQYQWYLAIQRTPWGLAESSVYHALFISKIDNSAHITSDQV